MECDFYFPTADKLPQKTTSFEIFSLSLGDLWRIISNFIYR